MPIVSRAESTLREIAYERFKAHLFGRKVAAGQFMSQGELCEMLEVGLGPMREALKRLEAEHLVRLIPKRGIQILDIGVDLIHNAFELRRVLETAAVRRFAKEWTGPALPELEAKTFAMLERMKTVTEVDDELINAALAVDWAMHDLFVEATGNDIMIAAYRTNFDKIRMIRLHGRSARAIPVALSEHLAVLTAVRARDGDAAASSLENHLLAAELRALGVKKIV
jgi:DNA-binding GntR family transcriptional regulator